MALEHALHATTPRSEPPTSRRPSNGCAISDGAITALRSTLRPDRHPTSPQSRRPIGSADGALECRAAQNSEGSTRMDTPERITKANYFEAAQAFVAKLPTKDRQNLPTITDKSENFAAWRQYFERHLRWTPFVLKLVLMGRSKSLTVPAYWPGWFDSSFVEDPNWRPVEQPVTPKHMRETLEQLRRRYGPNWGLQSAGKRDSHAKPHDHRELFGAADLDKPLQISPQLTKVMRDKLGEQDAAE